MISLHIILVIANSEQNWSYSGVYKYCMCAMSTIDFTTAAVKSGVYNTGKLSYELTAVIKIWDYVTTHF